MKRREGKLFRVLVLMVVLTLLICSLALVYSRVVSAPAPTTLSKMQLETDFPSPTSTLTLVPIVIYPTLTPTDIPSPTPVPTLQSSEIQCQVPVSIMLHWYDSDILPGLLDEIQNSGYIPITYVQWYYYCQNRYDTSQAVILTFDDAGPAGIYSTLRWMISYTNQRGILGVVGVVMGDLSEEEWDFLRVLHTSGWEIANHSKTHPKSGLPFLSGSDLREEILYVQTKVYQNIGVYPLTLILPGGTYNNDRRIDSISKEFGIQFIVGIATSMDPWILGEGPYYVGRVPPNHDLYFTPWTYALRVFGPQASQ